MFYVILYSRFQEKAEIELDIIFINYQYGLQCEVVLSWIIWLDMFRGDWGTLRRKNSNPPNIDLIFKIKYFDDTYGYSIQWGYI